MAEEEKREELISVREAAKECGRNMETIRRWIWAGKLPAEKLGNQLFIKKSDLVSYCRLPERSVPAKVGRTARQPEPFRVSETAVKYRTEPEADFLEKARALRERIRDRTGRDFTEDEIVGIMHGQREERMGKLDSSLRGKETVKRETEAEKKGDFLERAIALREKIHARTGKVFDAEAMIRELREERDRETG